MIRATFLREGDRLIGFECAGHSGYAERGSDIVCAAVSALLITAANAAETLLDARLAVRQDEDTGYLSASLSASLPADRAGSYDLLLKAARVGLEDIEKQYPDNVRVITRDRR